ncbi:MAG: twin-arginine translocase subunit TatC [Bacteroidales bacterium]
MAKRDSKAEMSFLEHLEELRWHLIRSFAAILILAIVAFIFNEIVFDVIILAPKNPDFFTNRMLCALGQVVNVPALCINSRPFEIININMAGQFSTHIMVSVIAGIIVAFPYIFYEFWMFFKPALYEKEKSVARGAVFYSSTLFALGVLFGYYVIVPLSVHFLGSYSVSAEVENQINLISYISTVSSVTLASGLIFELPVLVFFLTKVGLVTPEFLKRYRRHAIILILVLAAIITPPDVFSQILVCFPLIFLYEIGINISRRVLRREEARMKESEEA